jgi:hypothetical protein
MMEKEEFTQLYSQWFALHPFKKRDWPELGKVHFEAFGKENAQTMREALGQLTEEIDNFPSPKQIRSKLNFLSNSKTEVGSVVRDTAQNEEIACRLFEHLMGIQYNGVEVKRPDGVQDWHERIVDDVINSGLADHHLTGAYSTIGLKVIRAQG